jgi:hypothetical protein
MSGKGSGMWRLWLRCLLQVLGTLPAVLRASKGEPLPRHLLSSEGSGAAEKPQSERIWPGLSWSYESLPRWGSTDTQPECFAGVKPRSEARDGCEGARRSGDVIFEAREWD